MAWHIAALSRASKLPKLEEMLDTKPKKTTLDGKAALVQLAAMFDFDREQVNKFLNKGE